MRRIVVVLGIFILVAFFLFAGANRLKSKIASDFTGTLPEVFQEEKAIPVVTAGEERESIFVPYWALGSGELEVSAYDPVIYFGVVPSDEGIDSTEEGFRRLQQFASSVPPEKRTLLTLRMLDSTQSLAILKDDNKRESLINETIAIANQYGFDGIVLDLELKALPFDSVLSQVNDFVAEFASASEGDDLTFSIALYGDTFYRARPFDVGEIARHVDEVMIMAYDFHKSGGLNPGPNFPLKGQKRYGYDLETLLLDFTKAVPPEKLTIIFGMFGYDWEVDDERKAVASGVSLSTNKIQQDFIDACMYRACRFERETDSSEIVISYEGDGNHVVWFEDGESVRRKKEASRNRGVGSFSYWAYSYF